jgi:hypothetical protein
MKRLTYYLLATLIFVLPLCFSACKHQKCPAYMTKEETETYAKKYSSKKNKVKKKDLF